MCCALRVAVQHAVEKLQCLTSLRGDGIAGVGGCGSNRLEPKSEIQVREGVVLSGKRSKCTVFLKILRGHRMTGQQDSKYSIGEAPHLFPAEVRNLVRQRARMSLRILLPSGARLLKTLDEDARAPDRRLVGMIDGE